MNAVVSIGARFTAVLKLAEHLDRSGSLERLITFTPRQRLSKLAITERRIVTMTWLGGANYASRYLSSGLQVHTRRWIADCFDRGVSRRMHDCDIFYGWSGSVLNSMREAKRRGAMTVVGTGSAHARYQKEVVEAEYEKFGVRQFSRIRRLSKEHNMSLKKRSNHRSFSVLTQNVNREWNSGREDTGDS